MLTAIAACSINGVIGNGDRIPWHNSEDFKHFKATTMGKSILMGRRTFEAIGKPLPGRKILVLTKDLNWSFSGVKVFHDKDTVLRLYCDKTLYICGGTKIYSELLPYCDELLLSRIPLHVEGDKFFPKFSLDEWRLKETVLFDTFSLEKYSHMG